MSHQICTVCYHDDSGGRHAAGNGWATHDGYSRRKCKLLSVLFVRHRGRSNAASNNKADHACNDAGDTGVDKDGSDGNCSGDDDAGDGACD